MAFSSIYCDFPELKSFQRLYEYEQFFEQILSALQHSDDIIVRLCQHIISLRKLWFIASAERHVSCKINRLFMNVFNRIEIQKLSLES